ncbi:MAG: dihydrolipoyl dehydrogenase [Sphingobium sp.]|uniref:dihydrolipoyl dehydrogenase n=1 Tax=Sphingobium sp. TaxID=1912891 RepID=UPI0029BE9DA9|nr:dihydrolipoyl dehydrogenase [Sphingobium sp.]MDX3910146.1 dihydrolipoyl dehydrogenase [Sphingobium sp.]
MSKFSCDVAIIGAGTAGLGAERAARAKGAKTLLIDEAFAGTTCTTVGCMPSKLLIAAGNAAHDARGAEIFGVKGTAEIDGAAVMTRLRGVRDGFVSGVKDQFAKLLDGSKHKARARFDGPNRLILDDGNAVMAKAIVIATGARPSIPDFLANVSHAVLTNETLFELDDLPQSVGVIGAGPLGLELAQALARLGVDVAVFDKGGGLAGLEDDEIAEPLRQCLEAEFLIHLGVKLTAATDGKAVAFAWTGKSKGKATFSYILAAAGRPAQLDIGLETTGLRLDKHGAPEVDPATMQCEDAPIFMAGDADHSRPVLHEAQAEGAIAGHNAACYPNVKPGERMTPMAIMFTSPAMAQVGEVPKGAKTVSGSASYSDQGRAKVFATNAGCVKIVADAEKGKLLAAHMVGPAVEHSAHLLAWAIQQGLTADALLKMPFYHPTYEEGLQPALRAICVAVGTDYADRDGFVPGS